MSTLLFSSSHLLLIITIVFVTFVVDRQKKKKNTSCLKNILMLWIPYHQLIALVIQKMEEKFVLAVTVHPDIL